MQLLSSILSLQGMSEGVIILLGIFFMRVFMRAMPEYSHGGFIIPCTWF